MAAPPEPAPPAAGGADHSPPASGGADYSPPASGGAEHPPPAASRPDHPPRSAARRNPGLFVATAPTRLLPLSVPMRFFAAGLFFHALGWAAMFHAAEAWADREAAWPGGLGWPLAALHALTLGTLVSCAIGASLQLLPVATRQGLPSPRWTVLLWWVYAPGVAWLLLAMGLPEPAWLLPSAAVVIGALAGWAVLLAHNLRGARGMPGVMQHGWAALAALALLAASALALVMLWIGQPWLARDLARELHLLSGAFGVMGLLVLGFSVILLPLFLLAPVPEELPQQRAAGLAIGSLLAALMGALAGAGFAAFGPDGAGPGGMGPAIAIALRLAAWALAIACGVLHWRMLRAMAAQAMRPALGRAGRLMRWAWGCAALALLLALPMALGVQHPLLARLFGLAAIGGWLTLFLFAALQRILPFLGSMHAAGSGRKRPPTPSALSDERLLAWHEGCHLAALMLLALAAVAGSLWLARAAAAAGLAGALTFAAFHAVLLARLARHSRAA